MKKPSTIKIGPYTFTVDYVPMEQLKRGTHVKSDEGIGGDVSIKKLTLRIASDLAEDHQKVSLLHEILHLTRFVLNERYDVRAKLTEEDWVSQTTPFLLSVLQDNPELREYLFSKEGQERKSKGNVLPMRSQNN